MPAQSSILRDMVVAIPGSSLTTGIFSADWVPTLNREARTFPEAKGPIFLLNLGKGGRTSLDGLAQAPLITSLKPTHILTEGYAINDCFDTGSGPVVSRATHIADIQGFVSQWQAGIPGVDITLQTMNSVSTYQTARTALGTYYADELTTAAGLGIGVINNYAGWPKPLDGALTYGGAPFSITPTAGFVGFPPLTTFDPAFTGNQITLSADLLTALNNGGIGLTQIVAMGIVPITGKMHWEQTIDGLALNVEVGVATHAQNLSLPLSTSNNSLGMRIDGTVFQNANPLGNAGFTLTDGDVVGIEVDPVAGLIYFMKGAVRSAGFTLSGITAGTLYPAMMSANFNQGVTAHFGIYGDGLHPLWAGADDTYLYPNVVAWLRAKMAVFWP